MYVAIVSTLMYGSYLFFPILSSSSAAIPGFTEKGCLEYANKVMSSEKVKQFSGNITMERKVTCMKPE